MLTSEEGDSGDNLREEDRYVLIKTLPDGTPAAVRPMPSLKAARAELAVLNSTDGGFWHIFDHLENRTI